ncbi:MAG: DNA polymerase IV [Clostridia bacterium]|nr:DNA polymerase IV [Clostridia bacterium]
MADRVILHCDCNSFFASVETVLNPAYKNVPMAVCGSEENRHGIVLAKNELAKKYGITTAETIHSAKRKCPSLVIAAPHYEKYAEFSRRANEIYARYTDMIEPFGIDESWLDVTGSRMLFGDGREIAEKISSDIKRELGITVSIGVSFNKVFAKLGSDYRKPDAITVIGREDVERIVYPLPISDLLFVGKKTAEALRSMGIRTIGELAAVPENVLTLKFGKSGEMLYKYSRGLDDSAVSPATEDAKSVSAAFTFKHDLTAREELRAGIEFLSDEISMRLRAKGVVCRTLQVSVKDGLLRVVQRQRPVDPPSNISRELANLSFDILMGMCRDGDRVRMLSVCATGLVPEDELDTQLSILPEENDAEREKMKKVDQTVDKIRQKYGTKSIIKGAVVDTDIGVYDSPRKKVPK